MFSTFGAENCAKPGATTRHNEINNKFFFKYLVIYNPKKKIHKESYLLIGGIGLIYKYKEVQRVVRQSA